MSAQILATIYVALLVVGAYFVILPARDELQPRVDLGMERVSGFRMIVFGLPIAAPLIVGVITFVILVYSLGG